MPPTDMSNDPSSPLVEMPSRRTKPSAEPKEVQSCNFRYAGRLSNDSANALFSLFAKFALNVSIALEAYLGANVQFKLSSMTQLTIQEYLEDIGLDSYLAPCSLSVMDAHLLMQIDHALALPIIDLLLGGSGEILSKPRELTDLDEEVLSNASVLFLKEIERIWRSLNLSYNLLPCVRPASVTHLFEANEKVAVLFFELEIGATTGAFRLVLPTSFVGYMVRHLNSAPPLTTDEQMDMQTPTLRQRMLNCRFLLSADITEMNVRIRDLIDVTPGQVIKMRASVKDGGYLTVEGREILKANPVRKGSCKAAQVAVSVESLRTKIM